MEDQIEALIYQEQKNNKETNDNLEAIIVQLQKNDNKDELEAIAKSNLDLKEEVINGNKELISAIKDIKFPEPIEPLNEISIKNTQEINKDVISGLNDIKKELEKPQEINITLELI